MTSDRRNYRRIPFEASVNFQELAFGKPCVPQDGLYGDLSVGGILLGSAVAYPMGTLLKLAIKIPGLDRRAHHFGPARDSESKAFVAVGQVVRLEQLEGDTGFELGVKFVNVDSGDLASLRNFVDAFAVAEGN